MRISLRLATFVASILTIVFSMDLASAQGPGRPGVPGAPPAQGSRPDVVVLDISRVFKEHIRFKQSLEDMKKDVEAFEGYIRQERKRLTDMAEELKRFSPGTKEYKDLEQQMAQITANVQVETNLKRNDFMDREAKVYFNVYNEVTRVVEEFSRNNGINLVLRHNSEKMEPTKRDSVLAGVNSAIVFHNNLDITDHIIGLVNRGVPSVGAGPGPRDAQIPRPGVNPQR